jgi:predicted DNA-binding protein with PD1-like motif
VTTKLLNQRGELRTFAVVFDVGDDPVTGLEQFARDHGISGAQFTGIGALSHLLEAAVRPTLEVIIIETLRHLARRFDDATGLVLIDLSA